MKTKTDPIEKVIDGTLSLRGYLLSMKTKPSLTQRRKENATKKLREVLQQRIPDIAPFLSYGNWEPLGRSGIQIDLSHQKYGQYHFTVTFDTGSDNADDFSFEKNI